MSEFFKDIGKIPFEGPSSKNPLAFRYYDANRKVMGKTLQEHLRPGVAYWHAFASPGADMFGPGTFDRPWFDPAGDPTGYPLDRDFPREEYEFRMARARRWMAEAGLDALVITSRGVGQWFTGRFEPHSWHDEVSARSAWFILGHAFDCLVASPTNNHHLDAIRRSCQTGTPSVLRIKLIRYETEDL